MYRAGLALVRGDVAGTQAHARRALELAGTDDDVGHGAAACLLGLAYWTTGDLDAAHHWYADGMASLGRAGHRSDVVGGAITLADLRIAQGRLRDAMTLLRAGAAGRHRTGARQVLRGAADMHVGMSEVFRERHDVEAVRRHLATAGSSASRRAFRRTGTAGGSGWPGCGRSTGIRPARTQLLDEAERVYTTDFSPDIRPIPAIRARLWLAQGRLDDARAWVREQRLAVDDELSYLREYRHVTLARVLLAEHAAERWRRR